MKLLVASRNPHKIEEIKGIFRRFGVEIVPGSEIAGFPEIVEDGKTFQANAVKKAVMLALFTGRWALADDSGLEVEALNGIPGVRSARFAGDKATCSANNAKLLGLMKNEHNRRARFVCVLALSSPNGRAQIVEGICDGSLSESLSGENGFGYDPLFVPENSGQTFAQMEAVQKNRISHRARALESAMRSWGEFLARAPADWPAQRRPCRAARKS